MSAHPFAPNAIEHHRRPRWGTRDQRRALVRAMAMSIAFLAASAFAGFCGGLIAGAFQ